MNQKSPERDSKELPDSAIDGSYKESSENAPHLRSNGVHRPPVNGSIESVTASSIDEESSGGPKNNLIGEVKVEKWWQLLAQVSIPFLIAGCGTIGAGVILGQVKTWQVFESIPELFILVPALMGLKGNLDMTLAARLSTQANLGNMSKRKEVIHMAIGNIAIVQVQAIIASFLISIFAISIGFAVDGSFNLSHAFIVTTSSIFTATSSCFVLDLLLVGIILLSVRYKLNPDNFATPMAAAIGDVVTLSLLALITSILYANKDSYIWVTYVVLSIYIVLLPLWTMLVLNNRYTRPVLKSGWIPVLSALLISGISGLLLGTAVTEFSGFVVFQPIINGVGGNLVSVQACKISTLLYLIIPQGVIPYFTRIFELPWRTLFSGTPYANSARVLILMSIPGQVLFIFIADFLHMWSVTIGAPFVFTYLFVSVLQVMILLYISHVIVHGMWRFKIDPDTAAIPYLTSLGDLIGSSLLFGAFAFLRAVGHGYEGRDTSVASELLAAPFDHYLRAIGQTKV